MRFLLSFSLRFCRRPRQKGRLFIAVDFVSHEEMAVGHFLALNEIFVVFQFRILCSFLIDPSYGA